MPITAENPIATGGAQAAIDMGQPPSSDNTQAIETPISRPTNPPATRERGRLNRELAENILASRAERHAQADLARSPPSRRRA